MTDTANQIALLAAEIQDDIARAERMDRGTIGLHLARAYVQRLEQLLADAGGGQ